MSEEFKIFLIFIIWLLSAYFGSFSSWGVSAISIGLMVTMGIPPQLAGITFKLGKIGDTLGWLYHFHKGWHIPKYLILGGGLALMIGSFLGSYIIVRLSDTVVYIGCGMSMLTLALISLVRKTTKPQKVWLARRYVGFLGYFILSIIGNMFPAGSGVWYYFNNTLILRLSPLESKGIASVLAIFWFVGTFTGIMTAGIYEISWAIALAVGMFIGGYFGTQHIIKIGNDKLKHIFLVTIVCFALYFLYLGYNSFV
jgi:uncharacterized protein